MKKNWKDFKQSSVCGFIREKKVKLGLRLKMKLDQSVSLEGAVGEGVGVWRRVSSGESGREGVITSRRMGVSKRRRRVKRRVVNGGLGGLQVGRRGNKSGAREDKALEAEEECSRDFEASREKGRLIREYLTKLQEIVPLSRKDKRLSKLEVITNAIAYIRELRETLGLPPGMMPFSGPPDSSCSSLPALSSFLSFSSPTFPSFQRVFKNLSNNPDLYAESCIGTEETVFQQESIPWSSSAVLSSDNQTPSPSTISLGNADLVPKSESDPTIWTLQIPPNSPSTAIKIPVEDAPHSGRHPDSVSSSSSSSN